MIERSDTIASTVGLHARQAGSFAEATTDYEDLEITTAAAGEPAEEAMDATSVLSLMGLGAAHGDTVVLRPEGAGAEDALGHLVQLLEINHDAE